ncbi:hypothetical protein BC826DRAFT_1002396 [Russula brevipes]|nr:hypothetical protein BC826DRAFT_1002396 [Russula brevipes]
MCVLFLPSSRPFDFLQLANRLSPSEEVPVTPYGRDVLYTLGSPVGYSDHLLAEMSIFMATYLVYCT